MSETAWKKLLPVSRTEFGQGRFVVCGEQELAVFRLEDPERFFVVSNSCPHAGGNLSAGEVEGRIVTCPWHHWKFDLSDGRCIESGRVLLRRYEWRVEDGYIYVRLESPPPPRGGP